MSDVVECALLGGDCKAYYNSATYDTPTWVEIDEAIDVSIPDFTDTMAEILTRSGSFALNKPAKTRVAAEMSYLYKANQTVWDYLKGQKLAKGLIDLAIMDGDIATDDNEGLRMISYLEGWPVGQALEEPVTHDTFRFVPAYACESDGTKIEPAWVKIVTGVITPQSVGAKATYDPETMALLTSKSRLPAPLAQKLVKMRRLKAMAAPIPMLVGEIKEMFSIGANDKTDVILEAVDHMPDKLVVYIPQEVMPKKPAPPPAK